MAALAPNVTANITDAEVPQTLLELTELSLSANLFWWAIFGFLGITIVTASAGTIIAKIINAGAAVFMRQSGASAALTM